MPQSPLGKLIDRAVADKFGTADALAKAMGISAQTISRYRIEFPLKTLVPSMLISLARASDIPLHEVVRAGLSAAELPDVYETPSDLIHAVREDQSLTRQQRTMVEALIRQARQDNDVPRIGLAARPNEDGPDTPTT